MKGFRKKWASRFTKTDSADLEKEPLFDGGKISRGSGKKGFGFLLAKFQNNREMKKINHDSLSDKEKSVLANQNYFVINHVSLYIIIAICSGSYLAGLLAYVGIPPAINGIISALPVLAGVLQIPGAVISSKLHTQKSFFVVGTAVHRICLSVIFVFPLLFGPTLLCVLLIVATYAIGYIFGAVIGPCASNWAVSIVSFKVRGKYFGARERLSLLGAAAATIVVSIILDKSKAFDRIALGFAIVGFILLATAVWEIVCISKIYEPKTEFIKKRFDFRSLLEPIRDKQFTKVTMIYILWQISNQMSIPFMGIYYINTIKMTYTFIGAVALIVTLEKAFLVFYWGKVADRKSWDFVLKFAFLFYASFQSLQLFLSPANSLWLYPTSQIVGNVAWSVLNVALLNMQFQFLKPEKAVIYIGVNSAISSMIGFGAALVGSKILTTVNALSLAFNGYQVLIFISAVVGFGLSIFIHKSMGRQPAKK